MLAPLVLFAQGERRDVLFIGNSYTYSNNLPDLVTQIALSMGDTVVHASSTPGGYTLESHSTNATTLSLIAQGGWDHVVIQEQSQRPSFSPSQVAMEVFPFAELLVDSILSASPCADPVFFMTWGRENGDQQNCQFYPPVCTYSGMQQRLRESYLQMAVDNSAWCAPVGAAWKTVRDDHPTIPLYNTDGSHPNANGSYLAASVMYCTMFGRNVSGSTFDHTLDPTTASTLRQIASTMVLDSVGVWNIGVNDPNAAFTHTTTDLAVSLVPNATSGIHLWDFGDGNSSTLSSPSHTYVSDGSYTIIHTLTDQCGRTAQDTLQITVSQTSVAEEGMGSLEVWLRGDHLMVKGLTSHDATLELIDERGRLLLHGTPLQDGLIRLPRNSSGAIIYRISSSEGTWSGTLVRP